MPVCWPASPPTDHAGGGGAAARAALVAGQHVLVQGAAGGVGQMALHSGIFTLLPLLTGEGREHHGAILAEAAKLAEAGAIVPALDPRRFSLAAANDAYAAIKAGTARGKLVIDVGEEHAWMP